jgi:hypothetical protein
MTIYNIFELCQVEVPQASQSMILSLVNEKIQEFCHRTEVYKKTADLTIIPNTVSYTLLTSFPDIDTENIIYVIFKDSSGVVVPECQQLTFSVINGVITFYDSMGGNITSIPSTISTITFVYVAIPTTKVITDALTEIPNQFHEHLRSGVMETLYKLYPTIQRKATDGSTSLVKDVSMIQFSGNDFEKGILRGTRFANTSPQTPKQIFNEGF